MEDKEKVYLSREDMYPKLTDTYPKLVDICPKALDKEYNLCPALLRRAPKTFISSMAEYQMKELTLPGKDGEKTMYPKMKIWECVDLETLVRSMSYASSFTPGDIVGIVRSLAQAMAENMADGNSVKIDGIGVFTPSLGLRKGVKRESGVEDEPRRNAASICVDSIRFRPARELLHETGKRCQLHRSSLPSPRSSKRYTPEERLALAKQYLESHPYMRVADYTALTGLLRSAAAKELKQWAETEHSGIGCSGRSTHKVYIKEVQ